MEVFRSLWKTFRDLAQRYALPFIVLGLVIRVIYFAFIIISQKYGINPNMYGDIKLNIVDGQLIWENLQLGRGFFYGAKFPFLGGVYVLFIYLAGSGLPAEQAYFWFAFSQMLMEFAIILASYFVVKAWTKDTTYAKFAVIMWLFNPFWLLTEVIDTDRIGYHPTDYLVVLLVLLAMYFYTKEGGKKWSYLFLALTVSVKIFTLPIIALLAFIYVLNPNRKQEGEPLLKINWMEIKNLLLFMGIPLFLTFLLPIFLDLGNLQFLLGYRACSIFGGLLPLPIRILPPAILAGIFILLLVVKPGSRDLWTCFNWAIVIGVTYWFISQPYLRYFVYPLLVGLARKKVKMVIMWSVIGTALSIGFFLIGIFVGTPFGEFGLFVLPGGIPFPCP